MVAHRPTEVRFSSGSTDPPTLPKCRIAIPTLNAANDANHTKYYDAYIFGLNVAAAACSERSGRITSKVSAIASD